MSAAAKTLYGRDGAILRRVDGFLGRNAEPMAQVAFETWEAETVARLRRVRRHPFIDPVVVAINLVLARMQQELIADAKGEPRPAMTVEDSIREILKPLAGVAGDANGMEQERE